MAPMPRIPYRPDPPPDLELSPLFELEGIDGAADWVRENLRLPATGRWIHDHTIAGHIVRGFCRRRYSSLELYNFVMAQSKSAESDRKATKQHEAAIDRGAGRTASPTGVTGVT